MVHSMMSQRVNAFGCAQASACGLNLSISSDTSPPPYTHASKTPRRYKLANATKILASRCHKDTSKRHRDRKCTWLAATSSSCTMHAVSKCRKKYKQGNATKTGSTPGWQPLAPAAPQRRKRANATKIQASKSHLDTKASTRHKHRMCTWSAATCSSCTPKTQASKCH
eukprot:1157955-Pelagomonas_calceolata.AAC.5